ncbi:MAG: TlpA disulfide reductase family protein [Planctomycetaceae bacterium]
MRKCVWMMVCALWIGAGCSSETPTPATEPAEVPAAGGSIELGNPGPPPGGQSEPDVEGGAGDAAATTDDAAATDTDSEGGCEDQPASNPTAAAAPATQPVTVQVGSLDDVERLITASKGKVVVVDYWSTSCIPCRKEFPGLVALHRDFGDKLVCISVSTDYSGIPSKPVNTYLPKVQEFLEKQGASFDNFLLDQESEVVFDQLKLGSIPAIYVYDASGELVERFADPADGKEFTYADNVRPLVVKLLTTRSN